MRKTVISFALCAMLFALCASAEAQQPTKIPRVGYLTGPSSSARIEAFQQGLRELGYVEGKNIVIEWRYADGKELARELVGLKVDVIVTGGPTLTRAAKEATSTIPVVMGSDPDPVGNGFVASLARPGGNITGLSNFSPELSGKRLELLKEIVPRLSRVAVLGNSTEPGGKQDRLPSLATELIRLKVDVIVTNGPYSTRAAKAATVTIPIVMAAVGDPVGDGIVASLARPGGNITGLSSVAPELSGKRLELLKEIVPKLSRVAVFGSSTNPNTAGSLREVELAAGALKVKLQYLDVLSPKDIETAFRAAVKARAEAVLSLGGSLFNSQRTQVVELAVKSRLPAIYPSQATVEAGGLMSYGVNNLDLDRRAATYVDKILKGAKPADLPVEQPIKFEFIINLKAAKQIGLTIPPNVLVRADRVIK